MRMRQVLDDLGTSCTACAWLRVWEINAPRTEHSDFTRLNAKDVLDQLTSLLDLRHCQRAEHAFAVAAGADYPGGFQDR